MNSTLFVLASLDGLAYAALVFLVSVGLSLIFGVLRIVNVAHGSLYAFGAYLAATLSLLVTPISPWLTYPALLVASLVLVVAALVGASVMASRVVQREATIQGLRAQLRDRTIDPATSTRNIRIDPSRTAPSRRNAVMIGASGEMADLKIDMSWSKFTAFRVTIDRIDQGRVAVLHNVLRDSNGDLHIGINSAALGPGSYQFEIEGLTMKSEAFAQAWVTVGVQR